MRRRSAPKEGAVIKPNLWFALATVAIVALGGFALWLLLKEHALIAPIFVGRRLSVPQRGERPRARRFSETLSSPAIDKNQAASLPKRKVGRRAQR